MLIRAADVEGRRADVRIANGRVQAVAPSLAREACEKVFDASGGALLPGLHDHHLHLLALAAALDSVACGPPEVTGADDLARALRGAEPREGWIRATGYHESVAGELSREPLDALRGDVPVRIQHRSGACWMLNGPGLRRLGLSRERLPDADEAGVERYADGRPTGRLFRMDRWLRARLGNTEPPDLARVGALLAHRGVTGASDATPTSGPAELAIFERATAGGALPQRLLLFGGAELPLPTATRLARGACKLMLDERALPGLDGLRERIAAAHAAARPVAIHCVTRSELVLALTALEEAGLHEGDRIEHASLAPPELAALLARAGVCVVTQPGFVFERGDAYLRDVAPDDVPWLYRCAGLLAAGVPLGAGTDAPFGAPDPWRAMRAAVDRTTREGRKLGPEEALSPERALALFTTRPEAPGGPPRRVVPGEPADLVLLHAPWSHARRHLAADLVAATWCAGRLVRAT